MNHPFDFLDWDHGRLRVNRAFAELLRDNGLTTFAAIQSLPPVEIARHVGERRTVRVLLRDREQERAFYLKTHGPASLKERLKPLFRLTRPVLGAVPEWEGMLAFHAVGIPTMVPVALGRSAGHSFVLTEALENCERLDHWLATHGTQAGNGSAALLGQVAALTRTMHAAGLHHQDFYLCHLLLKNDDTPRVHVIDLGRVRRHRRFSRRWIIKDLSQLHYSAGPLSDRQRLRFLRLYLGRKLKRSDRRLIARIERKAAAIARHSRKNRL